jgi:lipid II isoglutaminyl synthase (glutamine-hydrolysing)
VADSAVAVCLLFPDLLGTYGDRGNATVLARRLEWRGMASRVVVVEGGDPVPADCDAYIVGGGEDLAQHQALELLRAGGFVAAVERGAVLLAICAGYQLIGASYEIEPGRTQAGLDLVDVETVRGVGPRLVGEVEVVTTLEGVGRLRGYENHAGVTRLRSGDALGRRIDPAGRDLGPEGVVQGSIVGTYLHGPVLARNPALADWLLARATGAALPPFDERGVAAEASHLRATTGDRLPTPQAPGHRWRRRR